MSYKVGDIVLIAFPFTNLKKSKRRPVLIIKVNSAYADIVCFQITSNIDQSSLVLINDTDCERALPKRSYVKLDKCFTLEANIIDKKLSSVSRKFLDQIKHEFCNTIF